MIALAITLGIGTVVFQMFHQNERIFRDQNLIVEAQQTARAVVSQIADEIRMAGQGMPIYASSFDTTMTEPVSAILTGSTESRIHFRAGLSNIETAITDTIPLDLTLAASRPVGVTNASAFSAALGTTSPVGKFVYISGPASNDSWAWMRAQLTSVSTATNRLTVVPDSGGEAGRTDSGVRFTNAATITLEEAVAFYLLSGSVRRATAKDMTDQANPTWSTANEIGRNVSALAFTYYDDTNSVITPDTLPRRVAVRSVDVRVAVQVSGRLSNGQRPAYTFSMRTLSRNAKIR